MELLYKKEGVEGAKPTKGKRTYRGDYKFNRSMEMPWTERGEYEFLALLLMN